MPDCEMMDDSDMQGRNPLLNDLLLFTDQELSADTVSAVYVSDLNLPSLVPINTGRDISTVKIFDKESPDEAKKVTIEFALGLRKQINTIIDQCCKPNFGAHMASAEDPVEILVLSNRFAVDQEVCHAVATLADFLCHEDGFKSLQRPVQQALVKTRWHQLLLFLFAALSEVPLKFEAVSSETNLLCDNTVFINCRKSVIADIHNTISKIRALSLSREETFMLMKIFIYDSSLLVADVLQRQILEKCQSLAQLWLTQLTASRRADPLRLSRLMLLIPTLRSFSYEVIAELFLENRSPNHKVNVKLQCLLTRSL